MKYELCPFLIYFCAPSHFRDFLGRSVKTTTESIGQTKNVTHLIIEIQSTQIGK